MDKYSLSLKFFKRERNRRKRNFIKRKKRHFKKQLDIDRKQKFLLTKRGQVLLEGLLFIIYILSFLSMIQVFQSLARKEIQRERLSKQKKHRQIKAPWLLNSPTETKSKEIF